MRTGKGGRHDEGVSDVVATILLIGLSIAFFLVVALHVANLPSPNDPFEAQLRAGFVKDTTNNPPSYFVSITHVGGDRIPIVAGNPRVTFRDVVCTDTGHAKTRITPDAGNFELGERLVYRDCEGTNGGSLIVVAGQGSRRSVILQIDLPAPVQP